MLLEDTNDSTLRDRFVGCLGGDREAKSAADATATAFPRMLPSPLHVCPPPISLLSKFCKDWMYQKQIAKQQ